MRGNRLVIWYALLVILAMEGILFKVAGYLADYCYRALIDRFNAGVAGQQSVEPNIPYADDINRYAALAGLNPKLVASVIQAESSFQPRAVSPAGAYGLMQVIPGTWREMNKKVKACSRHAGECTTDCYFNPQMNIHIGTAYLGQLYKQYSGNMVLALAAYNAGPGAVDQYRGIPPYRETEEYVKRIIGYWYASQRNVGPDYIKQADQWAAVRITAGRSFIVTLLLLLLTLWRLFRHYRSWRWR